MMMERLVSVCGQMGVMTNEPDSGREDRAAGGKRIGGGTGGRGEDEAVGVELGERLAVHPHREADEARDFAAAEDGIVQATQESDASPGPWGSSSTSSRARSLNSILPAAMQATASR